MERDIEPSDHNPLDAYTMTEYDYSLLSEVEQRLYLEFIGILTLNSNRGLFDEE